MRTITRLAVMTTAALAVCLAWASALAQPAIPDPSSGMGWAQFLLDAIQHKQWGYVVAAALSGLVFAIRKYDAKIPKWGPAIDAFFSSDPGGVVLAFLAALSGTVALSAAAPGAVFGWAMIWASAVLAVKMVGVFVIATKFLLPIARWIWGKLNPTGAQQAADVAKAAETAASAAAAGAKADPAAALSGAIKDPPK